MLFIVVANDVDGISEHRCELVTKKMRIKNASRRLEEKKTANIIYNGEPNGQQ